MGSALLCCFHCKEIYSCSHHRYDSTSVLSDICSHLCFFGFTRVYGLCASFRRPNHQQARDLQRVDNPRELLPPVVLQWSEPRLQTKISGRMGTGHSHHHPVPNQCDHLLHTGIHSYQVASEKIHDQIKKKLKKSGRFRYETNYARSHANRKIVTFVKIKYWPWNINLLCKRRK